MKKYLYDGWKQIYNFASGGPSESSTFQQTGRLTPTEFVEAGDSLVQKYPVWRWRGVLDNGVVSRVSYLPENKQFLLFSGAKCSKRAPNLDEAHSLMEADPSGLKGFFVIHENTLAAMPQPSKFVQDFIDPDVVSLSSDGLERRYDISICYDTYYKTPRLYLFGYNSQSQPLNADEMSEDVYTTNRRKTVTVDAHPLLALPCISIHPCRHAETMKAMIKRYRKIGGSGRTHRRSSEETKFQSHQALFMFLKFMSSVIPTIQYDHTADLYL